MLTVLLCAGAACEPKPAAAPAFPAPVSAEEPVRLPLLHHERKRAAATFIGKFRDEVTAEVETVLQGQLSVSSLSVSYYPDSLPVEVGERVVVMVDDKFSVLAVMNTSVGPSLEQGVLALHTVDGSTNHFEVTALFTLEQLTTFIATGRVNQEFDVTLSFPDGRGGYVPSPIGFELHYDSNHFQIIGLPGACLIEQMDSPSFGENGNVSLKIDFGGKCSDDWTNQPPGRRVRFSGTVVGLDANGDIILALVKPRWPYLHRDEYDRLVADPNIEFETYSLELLLDEGERWVWHYETENLGNQRLFDAEGIEHAGRVSKGGTHHMVLEFVEDIEVRLDWADVPMKSPFEVIEAGQAECSFSDQGHERACKVGKVGVVFRPVSE